MIYEVLKDSHPPPKKLENMSKGLAWCCCPPSCARRPSCASLTVCQHVWRKLTAILPRHAGHRFVVSVDENGCQHHSIHVFNLRSSPRALHKLEPPSVLPIRILRIVVTVCYFDKLFFCAWILVLVRMIFTAKTLVGLSYVLLRGMFGHWK